MHWQELGPATTMLRATTSSVNQQAHFPHSMQALLDWASALHKPAIPMAFTALLQAVEHIKGLYPDTDAGRI